MTPIQRRILKIFLAGLSIIAFAWFFSLPVSIVIVSSIYIHEYGHKYAMDKLGLDNNVYLIPLLGGGTVPEKMPEDGKQKFIITIGGPLFGMLESVVLAGAYFATGIGFIGASAGLVAGFNLLNLAPILPLDGGRIADVFLSSVNDQFRMITGGTISIAIAAISLYTGYVIVIILAGLTAAEFARLKELDDEHKLSHKQIKKYLALEIVMIIILAVITIQFGFYTLIDTY